MAPGGRLFLERHGLDPDESLAARFSDWSDCYAFLRHQQTFEGDAADLWAQADDLWALVLEAQDPGVPAPEVSRGDDADSATSDESGQNSLTPSLLERAVDAGVDSVRRSQQVRAPARVESITLTHSIDNFDNIGAQEVEKGDAIAPQISFSTAFKLLTRADPDQAAEEYFSQRVDAWPAPRFVKRCVKHLFKIRRPSLMGGVPTAIAHFVLVESSSMSLVFIAWLLITISRMTQSWTSDEARDLFVCGRSRAYSLLIRPFQDAGTKCGDPSDYFDPRASPPLLMEPHLPIELGLSFYIPTAFLLVLVAYRSLLCLRYNALGPVNFASGRYAFFCWELTRSPAHRMLVHATLAAFGFSLATITIYSLANGVSFSWDGLQIAFNTIVMLDKLAELKRGKVTAHRFHEQAFFTHAVFKRSWMSLLTETSFHFSTRLMDALWRCRAGDLRGLRSMLEARQNGRLVRVEEFFALCEKAQISEANDKDNEEGGVDEEQQEGHARAMFGVDLEINTSPEEATQMMKEAIDMQHATESYINESKQMVAAYLHKAQDKLERAQCEKREAIIRANEKERELEEFRSLGEKLMMREQECARLRAEAGDASFKDSRIARLMDENKRLKRDILLKAVSRAGTREKLSPRAEGVAGAPPNLREAGAVTRSWTPSPKPLWASQTGGQSEGREPPPRAQPERAEQSDGQMPPPRAEPEHAEQPDGRAPPPRSHPALAERPAGREPCPRAAEHRTGQHETKEPPHRGPQDAVRPVPSITMSSAVSTSPGLLGSSLSPLSTPRGLVCDLSRA